MRALPRITPLEISRKWLASGLALALGCLSGTVAAQEPAPLLVRPAVLETVPARSRIKVGLGAPVPTRSLLLPNGDVQPASLQTEKPLPKPGDAKDVAEVTSPPEPMRMPTQVRQLAPSHQIMSGQPVMSGLPVVLDGQTNCCPPLVCHGAVDCCIPVCQPRSGTILGSLFQSWHGNCLCSDFACYPGIPAQQNRFRASFEYLLWNIRDDVTPPLVTAGPVGSVARLDQEGTIQLFGGNVDQGLFSGGRLFLNCWFDQHENLGLDGSFFILGKQRTMYAAASDGSPVLAHPIFSITQDREGSAIVAGVDPFQGAVSGQTLIASYSRLLGADLNLRKHLGVGFLWGWTWHLDGQAGVRYIHLKETLSLTDRLVCQGGGGCPAGTIEMREDEFDTLNNFYGGQLGVEAELRKGRWSVNLRGKVALGATEQTVGINGSTIFQLPAVPPDAATVSIQPGGVYAQPTNIGTYNRSVFSVVPELGVTLGYQLNEQWRVFVGYNALLWTNVVRPGRQMDRVINVTQVPRDNGSQQLVGNPRPAFNYNHSTFWTHGMTAGLEWRF